MLIFLGFKMVNFCQQVLKPLGSYSRVFTVFLDRSQKGLNSISSYDVEFAQVDIPSGLHKFHSLRNLNENIQAKRGSRHYLLNNY